MAQCVGVLAPSGRDAQVIADILEGAELASLTVLTAQGAIDALEDARVGALMLAEEALTQASVAKLAQWLADQPPWSDLPVIVLSSRNEQAPRQWRLAGQLGNVTFLERPLHPVTLVSSARAALRARARQHVAARYVAELAAEKAALHESEKRYRTLFNTIDEGFCVIEFIDGFEGPLSDYVHIEANAAYERHAGIPNVVGRKVREMVPGEADLWVKRYGEVMRTGVPIRFEQELVATHRHLELAAFRVDPPERRQVAVIFQDVTERRRAEIRLRELNETLERRVAEAVAERRLLADIVEGTSAFVQVGDLEFRWLAINTAARNEFERIFGVRPKVGASMLDALAHLPEQQKSVRNIWARAIAGEEFTEIAQFGNPQREVRFYEIKFNSLRNAEGVRIGAYQFVYDVTERLRDQERLAEATARVHEMAKLETIGQLTGGVAHDFNNLLTPIVGVLDILRKRSDKDERTQKLIDGAMQGAERARLLVQRLLTFARRQHLETRSVDVGALVQGMRDLIQRSIGPHIAVSMTLEEDLPPAKIDPNQLELALLNLAVNARDAMADGGDLTIELDAQTAPGTPEVGLASGRYVRLSVADNGVGMDEETLKRAVEPFFTTKSAGKGTGLGLSMVHGLAAQSGGGLRLESRPGLGTRAELWLPATDMAAEERPAAPAEAASQPRRASILLVDDEDLVRHATSEMLREIGHSVVEVSSVTRALAHLRSDEPFDLLITDYLMPQMRGSELIREAQALRPHLPALLITGYANLSEGEAPGAPRLAKPYREIDLAREVGRILAKGRDADPVSSRQQPAIVMNGTE